jgi:hypothetical protein
MHKIYEKEKYRSAFGSYQLHLFSGLLLFGTCWIKLPATSYLLLLLNLVTFGRSLDILTVVGRQRRVWGWSGESLIKYTVAAAFLTAPRIARTGRL